MKKRISEYKPHEMLRIKKIALLASLSPFAKFCSELNGYSLYYNNSPIDKWEAFYITNGNYELILSDNAAVSCKIKTILN